ncbi:MAG: hypothetical protein HYV94_04565 [Candidatus Rokubacteria bacterium]|nr:hypothetical protein [Candidatus Rokubacteria bacterium]
MTPDSVKVENAIELIFRRLCEVHSRDSGATLTRSELGVDILEKTFVAALRELRGPNNDQDLRICFDGGDPDRIGLGASWRGRCEDWLRGRGSGNATT